MKRFFKKLIVPKFYFRLPGILRYRLMRFYHEKFIFKNTLTKEEVFTSIWKNNYWGSDESRSGPGATLVQTKILRENAPKMFHKFKIESIFDAPCGDMNWMQHILKDGGFKYLGGDIVQEIIEKNKKKLNHKNVVFTKFDITSNTFPEADIWICRAVLYHLSFKDILMALERFLESNIKYILTTNCITSLDHLNIDIPSGDFRDLNLMLPPFNFPKKVLWEIDDYVPPHPPVQICLWSREQIEEIMPEIRANII
jgi:SAM-dependent methyltransferase